ncbi:MAG: hypothetical protein GY731_13700, partial [Gammaproteobacteria bacterium]|nr:hypothetical protein [Gammaproteobacteria bacterium]
MSKTTLFISILSSWFLVAVANAAQAADIELSATMVQALNKDRSTATQMFIGKDGMRSEMEQDGNSRIMIFNQAKGVM